jgi:glutamate-1-semialdehyde 2,1-aminomutase
MKRDTSIDLFTKAKTLFPGGVNSPVRAFKSVDGSPLFIKKGDGCYLWDEDDNKFIDFCCSWGPLILGHNHPSVYNKVMETMANGSSFGAPTRLENELASLILDNNKNLEKIRFVSSGTEAVMSGIRVARGYTGKNKILKFAGCYHGHVDALLVKAGSGLVTVGQSDSAGVPAAVAAETIVINLNDIAALEEAFLTHADDLAVAIIEPIPANNGLLLQEKSFLLKLRELCTEHGVVLFFDEVISGFRVAFGGAAEHYGIHPDIVSYGKIIGGGLPVGAYGGSKEIMACVAPEGPVYQAGTLSGNPVAMSAGIAQLTELLKPGFYEDQRERTLYFVGLLNEHAKQKGYAFEVFSIGSIFWLSFSTKHEIHSADEINPDMNGFRKLYNHLLENGFYMGPSGYEVGFISQAHTKEILLEAATIFNAALDTAMAEN